MKVRDVNELTEVSVQFFYPMDPLEQLANDQKYSDKMLGRQCELVDLFQNLRLKCKVKEL